MSSATVAPRRRLVFDTMILSAFAEADRLDVLGDLLAGEDCYTTDIVLDEVRQGGLTRPFLSAVEDAEWLGGGSLATDAELAALLAWVQLVGSGNHDLGEASVFAFAEIHGAIAVTDDRAATRVARKFGLKVHGTLWLVAGFHADGKLTEHAASVLIESLRAVGLHLPCTGSQFPAWAKAHGLLP